MKKILFFGLVAISFFSHAKEINQFHWNIFIKTHNREKFVVNFPKSPSSLSYDIKDSGGLFLTSYEDNIKYTMIISDRINLDSKSILTDALRHLQNFGVSIEKYSFSENKLGDILDVVFQDAAASCKARMVVTKNNIYTFFTSYKKGAQEKHNFFTKSFHIAS